MLSATPVIMPVIATMLAAQTAVIIATFAIAARKRNFLWSPAAAAGLGALPFSVCVFLFL